jgi:hypothetical protein
MLVNYFHIRTGHIPHFVTAIVNSRVPFNLVDRSAILLSVLAAHFGRESPATKLAAWNFLTML